MAQIQIFTRLGGVMCCCCMALLESKDVEFEIIDIASATPVQIGLLEHLGQPELPAVFIGGVHIGSYKDLEKLETDGNLDSLLEEFAVAINPGI